MLLLFGFLLSAAMSIGLTMQLMARTDALETFVI